MGGHVSRKHKGLAADPAWNGETDERVVGGRGRKMVKMVKMEEEEDGEALFFEEE